MEKTNGIIYLEMLENVHIPQLYENDYDDFFTTSIFEQKSGNSLISDSRIDGFGRAEPIPCRLAQHM